MNCEWQNFHTLYICQLTLSSYFSWNGSSISLQCHSILSGNMMVIAVFVSLLWYRKIYQTPTAFNYKCEKQIKKIIPLFSIQFDDYYISLPLHQLNFGPKKFVLHFTMHWIEKKNGGKISTLQNSALVLFFLQYQVNNFKINCKT